MTLQRWFLTTSLGLLLAAVTATSFLLVTTHETTIASDDLARKMGRAEVLRALGRSLSAHRRNVLLQSLTHEPQYADEIRRQEAAIARSREELVRGAADEAERRQVEQINQETQAYLDLAHKTNPALPTAPQRAADEDRLFEKSRETRQNAMEERLSSVSSLQREVSSAEHSAQLFSVLIVLLSTLGTLGMIISLRYRLMRPVAMLLATIRASQHRQPPPVQRKLLTGEFGTIQLALEDMVRTIEVQRVAQLTFISGVAHDLRNPLTAMRIVTQTINPERPPTEARLKSMFAMLDNQIRRLEHQLNDLLDSTQIEAGELLLAPEQTDLAEVVRQTAALMAENGRVTTKVPDELSCVVDRLRIQQVLANLVGNALKYSKSESPVAVELEQRNGSAVISVRDHGIGISEDDLRRLFTPFFRGRAADMKISGTGLGLSVARKIVVAHGGRIEVESEIGQGSVFRVHLPLRSAPGAARNMTAAPPEVADHA